MTQRQLHQGENVATTTPTLDELVAAVTAASPPLDRPEQRAAVALYRVLAEGHPVSAAALADRSGTPEEKVAGMLARWRGVFLDDVHRVIGFWGLALTEMPHRYRVGGRQLYTWCAWDTLYITPILDQVAEVESNCPVSGREVALTVTARGVRRVEPAEAVVSFLSPDRPWEDDVRTRFCHYVLFFSSPDAGRRWTHDNPGTFLLSVEDGFELGRRVNAARFGSVLDAA